MAGIKAVVFDLYGTLVKFNLNRDKETFERLLDDIGVNDPLDIRKAWKAALTENLPDLASLVKRIKPAEESNPNINFQQYEQEWREEVESVATYPETINVLEELGRRGIPLGLISNAATIHKPAFYKLGLAKYFLDSNFSEPPVIFSCDLGVIKPDPGIYHEMVRRLRIEPSEILMTGDKIHADVDGPKAVGMNAVHLDRTNSSSDSISTLEGIFDYI